MRPEKKEISYLAQSILEAPEDSAERIRRSLKTIRELRWVEAPLSWSCPTCSHKLEKMVRVFMPENGGAVRCKKCKYRSSTQYYLENYPPKLGV